MTPKQNLRLIGYIRVSRKNGRSGDSYLSPTVQREAIERWAQAHGATIVAWVTEEDRSGRAGKRTPEFEALVQRVESREADGILVWKFTRFGRSLREALNRIHRIEDGGAVVRSATEDNSKLMRNFLLAMAEEESDRLKASWADAQERATRRSVWVGAAPFGYAKDEHGRLVEDLVFGPVVTEAYRIAAREGLHAAIAYLADAAPQRTWNTDSVRKLLKTRTYLGENGKRGFEGGYEAHPALTTEAEHAAAQTSPRGRRANGDYLLSGIARCGACGEPLHGQLQTVRERSYRRYRCSNKACRGGSSILAETLDDHVRTTLQQGLAEGTLGDFEPSTEVEALAILKAAEGEMERFVVEVPATTPFYAKAVAKREADLVAARAAYSEAAGQAERSRSLPMPEQLDDPAQLERALVTLGAIGPVPVVARGRGPVDQRVSWQPLDGDDVPGALAA